MNRYPSRQGSKGLCTGLPSISREALTPKWAVFLLIVVPMLGCFGCGNDLQSNAHPGKSGSKARGSTDLPDEVRQQINRFVRGGFEDETAIRESICEEIFDKQRLDPAAVTKAIQSEKARLEKEKADWPKTTDCDRLFQAFAALNQKGVIALHKAGLTQDEGYELFREKWREERGKRVGGYCFYTGQDLDGALTGRGLFLAFGPASSREEKTEGPKVGQIIVDELKGAGLNVEWDGAFTSRIHLPAFDWKRH